MTNRNREREWGATDRGFRLCYHLLQRKMTTQQVADLLEYGSYSGADSLLKRLRAEGLVRDDNGYWYVVMDF
jgi:hypothetical protein